MNNAPHSLLVLHYPLSHCFQICVEFFEVSGKYQSLGFMGLTLAILRDYLENVEKVGFSAQRKVMVNVAEICDVVTDFLVDLRSYFGAIKGESGLY